MKKYKLTILEYSKVEYRWNSLDPNVKGLIVSIREFNPTDGQLFSSGYSQTYASSGSKVFNRW